ncbi:MAG: glutaredoxin family protein [Deltaproteobacteria bacterium]|nr:glutaredoxin family protein [Deltaproteobacteria bacterium]
MKKFLLIVAAFLLYQNTPKVESLFQTSQPFMERKGAVVLYATSWCGYCQKTREFLMRQGTTYIEYDIEKSPEGRMQHRALNRPGVPVLNVRGTIIHGFDEKAILAALK